jgi:hypothetical protein
MSEVYPTDNELLNLVNDPETGIEYIPTGTAPYYLHFRKLLHRLLLATKRANDLRVYDEGGLDVGVKSGKFWSGSTPVNYNGSSGNTLADDKDEIYIYLDASGDLVTDKYTAFPSISEQTHVRLAVAKTSGGDIESITDSRGHHNVAMPVINSGETIIESHTTNDTLAEGESGSVHTNRGATATVTLTLPSSASPGTRFTFAVQESQRLQVDPGTAAIRDDSGYTADKYIWADSVGECISMIADDNGDWVTSSKWGIWNKEP